MEFKKETLISVAEKGTKKELDFVLKNMEPRIDLPVEFYRQAIIKTIPNNEYQDWNTGKNIVRLLFTVIEQKIPVMELFRQDKKNTLTEKWVLMHLDEYFWDMMVPVRTLVQQYGEEACFTLFKNSDKLLKRQIVKNFCAYSMSDEVTKRLLTSYLTCYTFDLEELATVIYLNGQRISPETALFEFVLSSEANVRTFGEYYITNYPKEEFISFDDFAEFPFMNERIAKSARKCKDAETNALEDWARPSRNSYSKRLAVAYYTQTHKNPRTKKLVRKLLTDPETKVRREALVAFAGFKNVSKKKVIKELYRPKNTGLRTSGHILLDCFGNEDKVLNYLLSLPNSYRKVTMAYVDECEYYGEDNSMVLADILYMIQDEDVKNKLLKIMSICTHFLVLPKTIYIDCQGDVTVVAKSTSCLPVQIEVTDIIGDFYGEKIAIPKTEGYYDQQRAVETFEINKRYTIKPGSQALANIITNNK